MEGNFIRSDDAPRFWLNRSAAFAITAQIALLLILPTAHAATHPGSYDEVDGNVGHLRIYGSLTESTCQLAMDSRWQEVNLGTTDTAALQRPGDSGKTVTFYLQLNGCRRGSSGLRDSRTGSATWSDQQPSVAVSFYGNTDPDFPEYLRVSGASGLALKLEDGRGTLQRLTQRNAPVLIAPGINTLTYRVTPMRTAAPLRAGAWQAIVDFRLIYD